MKINQLINKYLNRNLSKQERFQLRKWVQTSKNNLAHFKKYISLNISIKSLKFNSDDAFLNFYKKIQDRKRRRKRRLKVFAMAASIAILMSLWITNRPFTEDIKNDKFVVEEFENQTQNQIQITLPTGDKQSIHKKKNSNLKTETGELLAQKVDGVMTFVQRSGLAKDKSTIKIEIPYGEKLNFRLSDGTLVWLNFGSSFTFPQEFKSTSNLREVKMKGEAYFEVAENKQKPFVVNTSDFKVKVLGTRFNVSSYNNNINSKVTLIEGKVQVLNFLQKKDIITLSPNQQLVIEKNSKEFFKNKVKATDYNLWIDNVLVVDGLSFLELTKKLERKYNVTITNEIEELWDNIYKGEFRDESLIETIETIALSSKFQYEIKGNNVRIYNKKEQPKSKK